jgi:hypothetical protein
VPSGVVRVSLGRGWELGGVGKSQIIAQILKYSLSAMCHYLEFYNCKYRLLCDPRESKEDKAVQMAADDYVRNHFGRALPKEAALYLGLDTIRVHPIRKSDCKFAGLLAGEIRSLFETYPELLRLNLLENWVLHLGPPAVGCENTPRVRDVYQQLQ